MTYNGSGRRLKAEETRKKIYQCAEELFMQHDSSAVSVDMIVKAAGVSKGTFYVHYPSKDALFMALVDDKVAALDADYKSWLDALPGDMPAADMLLSLSGRIADLLTNLLGIDSLRSVYRNQLSGDMGLGSVTSYSRDIYGIFRSVVERGISRGEFRTDLPADLIVRHLMLAFRGITYEWCLRYPRFNFKAQALAHISLLINGLRAPL